MKVPDVRRNLVPDTWTADGEGAGKTRQTRGKVSNKHKAFQGLSSEVGISNQRWGSGDPPGSPPI